MSEKRRFIAVHLSPAEHLQWSIMAAKRGTNKSALLKKLALRELEREAAKEAKAQGKLT